jgi:hypothetical protein
MSAPLATGMAAPPLPRRARSPAPYAIDDLSDDEGGRAAGSRASPAPAGLGDAAAAAAGLADPADPTPPGTSALSGEGWALEVTQYPGFLCRVVSRVRVFVFFCARRNQAHAGQGTSRNLPPAQGEGAGQRPGPARLPSPTPQAGVTVSFERNHDG